MDLTGQTLVGYEIISKLGAGGMGAVFKARQPVLDRIVALKVIAPQVAQDPSYIARFQHEAKSAARLNHPNIVQVYAAGEDSGMHFMVSEFVEGESLQQRLSREGRMDPQEALATCVFVAEGLKHAWDEARIIHRDIKPDNIFLSVKGVVKVGDLGLAKSVGPETSAALTQSGTTVGTPFYCSPEQAQAEKEIDFRADIYSLGCTLYHMLSGKRPYDSGQNQSPMSVMVKQIHDPPPAVLQVWPECPMPLVMLLGRMLKKNPNERHQSYEELIEDMRRVHEQLSQPQAAVPQPIPHAVEPEDASRKRMPMVMGGIAAVVVAAGLLLWAPWKQPSQSDAGRVPSRADQGAPKTSDSGTGSAIAPAVAETATKPPSETLAPPKTEAAPAVAETPVKPPAEMPASRKPETATAATADPFIAEVVALPAEKQIQRVMAELKRLNPDFDNRETHTIRESAVTQLAISTVGVKDISPLRALRQLDEVRCSGTQEEPSPLSDLSPLRGLSLRHLACDFTAVSDLSPLAGMPLAFLDISGTQVINLSPLADLSLTELRCPPAAARNKDIAQLLLKLPALQRVNGQSPAAFLASLAKVPAAEPASPQPSSPTPASGMVAPPAASAEDPFVQTVAALPAEQQVARVMARLRELNPQFDGRETHKVEGGAVTELSFSTVGVTDITPLKALKWLKKLVIVPPTLNQKGALADLAPLQGLPLTWLWCHGNPITDLTPLRGMPLTVLSFSGTQVNDLSPLNDMKLAILSFSDTPVTDLVPLEGMPLTVLWCNNTKVTDLSPLQAMPLQELRCSFVPTRDAAILRGIRTLARINDTSAQMFWIRVGPIAATAASRQPSTGTATTSGAQRTMTTSTGIELVWIPPGEFMMGSTKDEQEWAIANRASAEHVNHEGQEPRRAIIKNGLWLGRTEITMGQWKLFVSESNYETDAEKAGKGDPCWRKPDFGFAPKDNHAVTYITWNDAMAFCQWLTDKEKKAKKLPAGMVYRLPTEAEWEYACRAGKQTKFWWGDTVEGVEKRMNLSGAPDGFDFVSPVDHYGSRGRNNFGLADMLGNVWEWCLDGSNRQHADVEPSNERGSAYALRGGSFQNTIGSCRCAFRLIRNPAFAANCFGFRICCGVPEGSGQAAGTSTTVPTTTKVSPPSAAPVVGGAPTSPPLVTSTGMELLWIPPGEFLLGSTQEERAWALQNGCVAEGVKREGEAPRKAAIKQGFWMGKTEVTVGQWKLFVAATGYVTEGEKKGESYTTLGPGQNYGLVKGANWKDPSFGFKLKDNCAVSCISWNDAMAFCEWLSEREQKAGRLPPGFKVRLPTEAEWEYACRAGTQTKFWWGETKEGGDNRLNWSGKGDGFEFVSPVDHYGSRGRNKFGLADMLGNVWEWCLDECDEKQAHEECYKGNPGHRVLRGGSFHDSPGFGRCAYRFTYAPTHSDSFNGFRICVGVDR
ncbi:MAG: SUMF1/EgtB/PvdO family nonheme iron enzyme [Verrucomicrobia bacterium]|nr:SUMF1/EgtB/PvdO family nonheme iron enzyme [Verrucomicrobiota bacterium]